MRAEGKDINWLHSYVTDRTIHCVYTAPNPEIVREHAQRGGFPSDQIFEVEGVIDPATGDPLPGGATPAKQA